MIPKREYNIDLVFCLDLTSDARCLIEQFKNKCLYMFEKIGVRYEENCRTIGEFRVRIIGFKDFIEDDALFETDFFTIPEQTEELMRVVNALENSGGGDEAENGLEALALALKSPWTQKAGFRRHVVCVITDAPALDFNERNNYPNYPSGMPKDMKEFYEWYHTGVGTLSNRAKRLILLAPDDFGWHEISETWDNCWYINIEDNSNIEEIFDSFGDMMF